MPSKPKAALFTPFDTIFWGLLCGIPTGLGIAAAFYPQDPPVEPQGWVILALAILGMWGGAVLFFMKRKKVIDSLRFVTKHGITVGWEKDEFAVSPEDVEVQADELLGKMTENYPSAHLALRGCLVMMVEPTFWCAPVGFVPRKVAGMQDGMLLLVGWQKRLSETALQHELGHRVLQMFGDPPEDQAHRILERYKIS